MDGTCEPKSGRCLASATEIESLLIEVVPRASDQGYASYRFLNRIADVGSLESLSLQLDRPPRLGGQIRLYFDDPECITRTVQLTLVPRERALGMDVQKYRVTSSFVRSPLENELFESYSVRVPPGEYDLYFQEADPLPASAEWSVSACRALVPQLARGVRVSRDGQLFRNLTQSAELVRPLLVRVPGGRSLGQWSVDIVNQRTGERLSTVGDIAAAEVTMDPLLGELSLVPLSLSGVVAYSPDSIEPTQLVEASQQMLRLRPPDPNSQPTFLIPLAALETTRGVVTISPLPSLPNVTFQAWVWDSGDPTRPVPGRVEFSARSLRDVTTTQFPIVQFTKSADVADDGYVAVDLPPGTYDVRVRPLRGRGFATLQTELVLTLPSDSEQGDTPPVIAGQILDVPAAVELSGRVRLPVRGGSPVGLSAQVLSVRSGAPGVSSVVVRSSSVLLDSGRFELLGVDCRGCDTGAHASVDFRLLPPAGSELAWLVFPGVDLGGPVTDLGRLEMGAPYRLRGSLSAQDGVPYPGPLVRAFVLLNDEGKLERDLSLPLCVDRPVGSAERCLRRAIQVAETRAGEGGRFELLLPAALAK